MIRIGWIAALILLCGSVRAQDHADTLSIEEKIQKEYQQRIRKTHINGFYIPRDLQDALRILDEVIEESGRRKFAEQEEDFAVQNVFFSFGRWININWGMEKGSRLTVALNNLGLTYPDDMVRFVMYAYHRHLNRREFSTEDLVTKVKDIRLVRQKEMKEELEGG